MNSATTSERVGLIQATAAIAEAIREVGEIPSGHLYAMLLGRMPIQTYEGAVGILKRAGLVVERGDVLTWVGPKVPA